MIWRSDIWWTGAGQMLSQISPACNLPAKTITTLPRCTPLRVLLRNAGMTMVDLLLDQVRQQYGVLTHPQDNHQFKGPVVQAINNKLVQTGTGFQPIADLLDPIIDNPLRVENYNEVDQCNSLPHPLSELENSPS